MSARSGHWTALRTLSLFIALFFLAARSGAAAPPVEVPFAIDKKDAVAEFDLRVLEARQYTFGLSFLVDDKTPGDAQRVIALMGAWGAGPGKGQDAGSPLRVKLSVQKTGTHESAIFDREVSEIYWYSHGSGSYNKRIADIPMGPGIYKVRLENRLASDPMSGRVVKFHIYTTYLGK
jgi:hypothetical protein